jgi:uncharacterized integral membrane protein
MRSNLLHLIKKLSLLLAVLAVLVVTLLFSLENQQSVSLTFTGWSAPSIPVSFYIVAAFLLGLLLGPLWGFMIVHRNNKRLRK